MRHVVRWILILPICCLILVFLVAAISVISRPENFNPITPLALGFGAAAFSFITIWPIWELTKKGGVSNCWKTVCRWLAE